MKKLFGIFLVLVVDLFVFSQKDTVKIYTWDEVQFADPDTVFGLNMSKMKLDSLPLELSRFKALKYLDLSKNKLSELPDYIGTLNSIVTLDLSRNEFDTFPVEICRLTSIKYLILNRNSFDRIPECIGYCVNLEYLDLWDTPVAGIPNSIINLRNLKVLDLQGIKYGPTFQKELQAKLSWVKIKLDPPCDCME